MVDYKKSTGSSGTMMIRDNGTTVSFMINSNNNTTFINEMPWGYTVNGTTNNDRQSRYSAGAGWVTLGSWTVKTDQTVTFRLFDTNTGGLGGPTTLSASIERASVPDQPDKPLLTGVTESVIRVNIRAVEDNGSSINLYQIARNTSNKLSTASITSTSERTHTFTSLAAGTTYYFWARARNGKGYGPWSDPSSVKTTSYGDAPNPVIASNPTQTSVLVSFTDNGNGGSPITERQIAYNTSNTLTGATVVSYSGIMTITGLAPATTYYFWARVRNAAGWGPYSPVSTQRTVAGAWVNVHGAWKEAVPYVKSGGVWKLARPWIKVAGVWKELS